MKTRTLIGGMTLATAGLWAAVTVTGLATAQASAAETISMETASMHGGHGHHGVASHDGDPHHPSWQHFGGRRPGFVYIYPYYPTIVYPRPTYWYYCHAYSGYYPYVATCPESWVVETASLADDGVDHRACDTTWT